MTSCSTLNSKIFDVTTNGLHFFLSSKHTYKSTNLPLTRSSLNIIWHNIFFSFSRKKRTQWFINFQTMFKGLYIFHLSYSHTTQIIETAYLLKLRMEMKWLTIITNWIAYSISKRKYEILICNISVFEHSFFTFQS